MNGLLLPEDIKGDWGLRQLREKGVVASGPTSLLTQDTHGTSAAWYLLTEHFRKHSLFVWHLLLTKNLLFLSPRLLNVMHLEAILISASSCPGEFFVLWLCFVEHPFYSLHWWNRTGRTGSQLQGALLLSVVRAFPLQEQRPRGGVSTNCSKSEIFFQ